MIYSLHRFGARFDEYFLFEFYNLNSKGRNTYITDKIRYAYYEILNDRKDFDIFRDKSKTYEVFKEFYKRDFLYINRGINKEEFYAFAKKHERFIKKPTNMDSGKGIEICSLSDYPNLDDLFNKLINDAPCVIEEIVTNNEKIKRLSPTALSTIRIPTVLLKETPGDVFIFTPFIRFGRNYQIIDNFSGGLGIGATIDPQTGIVVSAGFTKDNTKYLTHPDTNEQILGFAIPHWDELIKTVKSVALKVPSVRYVGWDFALTDTKWVMIEANYSGALNAMQVPERTGKRELFEKLIME